MENQCYKIKNLNECEECLWAEVCDYYDVKYIEKCKPELLEKKETTYKALLLNTKGEIEDQRFYETYPDAARQCTEWQLKHEYDFWKTKIIKL